MFFNRNFRFVVIFVSSARNQLLTNIYAEYMNNLLEESLYAADEIWVTHHLHTMFNMEDQFYWYDRNKKLKYDTDVNDVTDTLMVRSVRKHVRVDPLTSCYVSMLPSQLYNI